MKQIELKPGLDFEKVLQTVKEEVVVFTRDGHAVALLSDFDDEDLYWHSREHDPQFIASIKKAREQMASGEGIRLEDVKRQLGIE